MRLPLTHGRAIDVGGGLFITRLIAARVAFTSASHEGSATLWVHETNMWSSEGVSGEGSFTPQGSFRRTEDSLSMGAVLVLPLHPPLQASAFAGPTYVRLRQDLMNRVSPSGFDFSARYLRANVDVRNKLQSTYGLEPVERQVTTGDWHFMGGMRFRF